MHLSPEFGLTYETIEADGFAIDAKVEMLLSSDTPVGDCEVDGTGRDRLCRRLDRLRPDIVLVLGDRFEILAAAQAALVARIPVAHIAGGETTEGAFDEAIRHAITKMAHLHFVDERDCRAPRAPARRGPGACSTSAARARHHQAAAAADRDELERRSASRSDSATCS